LTAYIFNEFSRDFLRAVAGWVAALAAEKCDKSSMGPTFYLSVFSSFLDVAWRAANCFAFIQECVVAVENMELWRLRGHMRTTGHKGSAGGVYNE
jgi:hypothetical protein